MSETQLERDDGLEWIKLRQEIDEGRREVIAKSRPEYKYNWYMPAGITITALIYVYGLYNMYDMRKSSRAAYCRIGSQFVCGSVFIYGFMKHYNKEIKLYKDEKLRRKLAGSTVNT